MNHKVTLTTKQWEAIEEQTKEHINRFSNWLADRYGEEKPNVVWLDSVKERYELWKDIQQALLDSEEN